MVCWLFSWLIVLIALFCDWFGGLGFMDWWDVVEFCGLIWISVGGLWFLLGCLLVV